MIRVNIRALTLYAFSVFIMYLAGVYFGTFLFSLFLMFLVLPVLSFVSFLVWLTGISCSQDLSRAAPVKGDEVELRIAVRNRSVLPISHLRVHFAAVSEALRAELEDFEVFLSARRSHRAVYRIACPYRGTYRLGVRGVTVTDHLGFFSVRRRIEPINITVYPRVLKIPRFAPVSKDVEGSGRYSSAGLLPDPTLFHQLKEYRDGDSMKHIYWKKYASTGKPYLKEYDYTKRAGVRIYFDTRPSRRWDVNRLAQEDASVEALVAIVRYLLVHRVHTTVLGGTYPSLIFTGEHFGAFSRFYRAAARILFTRGLSPIKHFQADRFAGEVESQTCIFVTHNVDPEITHVAEGSGAFDTILVLNRVGISNRRTDRFDALTIEARRSGRRVVQLRSTDSIYEDLTGGMLAHGPAGRFEEAPEGVASG
jgi:hypothetical protein